MKMHVARLHYPFRIAPKRVETVFHDQSCVIERAKECAPIIWNAITIAPEEGKLFRATGIRVEVRTHRGCPFRGMDQQSPHRFWPKLGAAGEDTASEICRHSSRGAGVTDDVQLLDEGLLMGR